MYLGQRLRSSVTSPNLGREHGPGGAVSGHNGIALRRSRTDSPNGPNSTMTSLLNPSPKAYQLGRSSTIQTTSSTTASLKRSDSISEISERSQYIPTTPHSSRKFGSVRFSDLPTDALHEELPHQLPPSGRPFKALTESQNQRGRSLERATSRKLGFEALGELPAPTPPLCGADRERSMSPDGGMTEDASRVDNSDFSLFMRQTCLSRSGSNLSGRMNRSTSNSNLSSRLNRSASNLSSRSTARSGSQRSDNSSGRGREEDTAPNASDRSPSIRPRMKVQVREDTGQSDTTSRFENWQSLKRSCSDEATGTRYPVKGFHPWRRSSSDGVHLTSENDFEPKLSLLREDSEDIDDEFPKADNSPAVSKPQHLMKKLTASFMATIGRTQVPAEPDVSLGVGVVIFDWDDTLLPTSYLKQVVIPSLPANERDQPISPESSYYNELFAHARMVEEVLRAANKVAALAIVTLATKWWVQTSAERYLPGLDFEGLLNELDLVVYPADRQSAVVRAYSLSGRDPCKFAKKVAMSKCLKSIYRGSDLQWNVLSVGDSVAERDALKECLASYPKKKSLCKTVKIRENLKLGELTKELQLLSPNLKTLISHKDDFDRTTTTLNFRRSSWRLNI